MAVVGGMGNRDLIRDVKIELEKLRDLRKLCHGPLVVMLVAFLLGFALLG